MRVATVSLRPILALMLAGQVFAARPSASADLADTPTLPEKPLSYAVELPPHLAALDELDNMPDAAPATDAGATLGRVLFYDRGLSANRLVSCSSCHSQSSGFDDPTRFSIGFQGRITRRSAMALANARFNPRGRYFHDERAPSLEEQVLAPFTDEIEMGLKPGELVERVAAETWYAPLFENAFGDDAITENRIARALAQFVRAMVSTDSKYDAARRVNPDPLADFRQFTIRENRGKFLFMTPRKEGGAGCAACHETDAFLMLEPRDNGLPTLPGRPDDGIGETTGKSADNGRFRTASLKNVAASAPYMHDGRFATLEEVINHYSTGIVDKPNLAKELRAENGLPVRFDFSQEDRQALIAFLKTLNDEVFLSDPKFANPFKTDER